MGFAFANEAIIQYMNNVKAPYNVNRLSQEVAVRALTDRALFQENVNAILEVSSRSRSRFFSENLRQATNGIVLLGLSPLVAPSSHLLPVVGLRRPPVLVLSAYLPSSLREQELRFAYVGENNHVPSLLPLPFSSQGAF